MNLVFKPDGWREVKEQDFKEYLKTCNDYRRNVFSDGEQYKWVHSDVSFAVIINGKVFVDHRVLK